MPTSFQDAYRSLNAAQKQAVDTVDGPLLVLAGPGTGKTQLLSTRAARIVSLGSAAPQNILCLTYTETGASEMRQRLASLMGSNGSEVAVFTFHGFGSWLIAQYPEFFSQERSLAPLDELGRYQIFENLLAALPFRHQLAIRDDNERFIRQHVVTEAIRACKEAGLTPDDFRAVLDANAKEYATLQPLLDELFGSTLGAKRLPTIRGQVEAALAPADEGSLSHLLLSSLEQAVGEAEVAGKTAAIGTWRDAHTRISNKRRVLKSQLDDSLLHDVAKLYAGYQAALLKAGKFDYEDMILWAINALQTQADMQLDVAERFQYIMVDEYQDTNGAQNLLLDSILHANPIDSPNVMVVGDDDQAIMRFQGAELSGMLKFVEQYQPQVVALEDNYRSNQPILDASAQVISASDERLVDQTLLAGITKNLRAHRDVAPVPLQFASYVSPSAEYAAVGDAVAELIEQGIAPNQIGIIGRKHATLAEFVPYLTDLGINIAYDRRENVLEHPAIMQLLRLADYLHELATRPKRAEHRLAAVLADSYWGLAVLDTYQIAAQARETKTSWLDTMLAGNEQQAGIAEWLVAASQAGHANNFTQMFDILIGRQPLPDTALGVSPFKTLYENQPPSVYAELLSHLICLRSAVLETNPQARTLADLLDVCKQYRLSGLRLLDDNPLLRGSSEGVQVMSAHGSKGREFEHMFVLSCTDEQWGSRARSNNQRIRLPENLPLYPAGDTMDDKLRLLYVAMTRAKQVLHLSSHTRSDDGRSRTPLSLLTSSLETQDWQTSTSDIDASAAASALETAWQPAPRSTNRSLQDVLSPLTKNYRLSPTALRDFLDICYAGPQTAIERHVLKFPSSYNAHSALGSAAHKTLQLAHAAFADGKPLDDHALLAAFDTALDSSNLSAEELLPARSHGHEFLPAFVRQFADSDFGLITQTEQFLRGDSPNLGIPLSGVLDAIETTPDGLRIIDYKTGKPPLPDWKTTGLTDRKKISLHFYRQQLLFYALLVPASKAFTERLAAAELVFLENTADVPDEFVRLSITDFTLEELHRTEQLIAAVHARIVAADLPDVSGYSTDLKGVLAFEDDLLQASS